MKKVLKYSYLSLFLLLMSVIYVLFMIDDLIKSINIDNALIKYVSIISINIFFLSHFIYNAITNKKVNIDMAITEVALIFTLISDTFLIHLDAFYEIGVSCFIVVQISYFIREIVIGKLVKKRWLYSLIIRISLFIIELIVMFIIDMADLLNIVTMFYFTNLIMNFLDSLEITYKEIKSKGNILSNVLFSVGLLLFIGCDICVGLLNLIDKGGSIIWMFYLPSQVLISLSAVKTYNLKIGGLHD